MASGRRLGEEVVEREEEDGEPEEEGDGVVENEIDAQRGQRGQRFGGRG